MNITQNFSPNHNIGRKGQLPDMIACHITEGSFSGTISWINNRSSHVSYHYVVARDGQIVQAVDIINTAWSNGTTSGVANNSNRHSRIDVVRQRNINANLYTISIGFEGRLSEKQGNLSTAQLIAAVNLISHIRSEVKRIFGKEIALNRESIVGHRDITPLWKPNCPGPEFPFEEIIRQLKEINMEAQEDDETMRFDISGDIYYIPAFIRNDRTYVQARLLLEAMGYNVEWDSTLRTVVVR